jgi:hypothetical protein
MLTFLPPEILHTLILPKSSIGAAKAFLELFGEEVFDLGTPVDGKGRK